MKKHNNQRNRVIYKILNAFVILALSGATLYCIAKFLHLSDDQFNNAAQVEEYIAPINSRVSGYIDKITFSEHQIIHKGDTLLVLNDEELQIAYKRAKAELMNALAAKESKKATLQTVNNNVEVASSSIENARVKLDYAKSNYNRYQALLQDQAVTPQQFEDIRTQYYGQKALYEQLIKQQTTTSYSANEVSVSLKLEEAKIQAAMANVEMAKLNLKYTVIKAPYDGTIGRRQVSEGQLIQAGQQVATLVQNKRKWVTANYLEKEMKSIKIGQLMDISVDALGGKTFEGSVVAISGATGARYAAIPTDNSAGNFVKVQQRIPVRLEFTNNNREGDLKELRAGMNVVVTQKK